MFVITLVGVKKLKKHILRITNFIDKAVVRFICDLKSELCVIF